MLPFDADASVAAMLGDVACTSGFARAGPSKWCCEASRCAARCLNRGVPPPSPGSVEAGREEVGNAVKTAVRARDAAAAVGDGGRGAGSRLPGSAGRLMREDG